MCPVRRRSSGLLGICSRNPICREYRRRMQRRCARSPQRTSAALQVQQSPWSLACPTDHAEPVDVVVESGGRIALTLAQRENSAVGSPKSAVWPRLPRRNSGAARTAPFSETRAAARASIRTAPCIVLGAVSDLGRATHVRPGLRFVQCLASCSSRSPSSPSPSPRRPLRSLRARALQLARGFLRDGTSCKRRSRGCMRRLHWSRLSWFCFAPSAATRPM